jgi:hypothetical protein
MRSRSSSKPKLMLGSVSASEGPPIGGRLVDSEGSNADDIVRLWDTGKNRGNHSYATVVSRR